MRLVVHEFLSLDGVMQGPGGPTEDTSGGFTRGGWIVPFAAAPEWGAAVTGWFAQADAILLGRTTYEMMYPYWSAVTDPDNSVATALNALPKYVVSSTLGNADWAGSTILSGDAVEAVTRLKAAPGEELQLHGSWRLARTLHNAGLVDEYRLLVFPVVVGEGKRLFGERGPATGLEVRDARILDGGTTSLQLGPAPFGQGGLEVVEGREVLVDR
ncbi:dihydrofolate reductase family protein [Georgenia faecalis]|uniref:Dihydrofolate reductase family protein n=1 Tax=Georgenia faecalis TaxID=2483799 RepID=A0ABV9D8C8_9MICO|nr:dihydrofolate reductase family protein [Georgenia faecalis]